MIIELQNVSKCFSEHKKAISNISLRFEKLETVVIIGPSGSGKSTLVRCINNLENPTTGRILINGKTLTSHNGQKLCFEIGMVFQEFYLFPHMNVLSNLTYAPINVIKISSEKSREKAESLLDQFGILEKANFYPVDLSGGEKQRVAIARALMMDPKVILFDEPTSALDPESIKDIKKIISQLKEKVMIIVITHHIKFAKSIANRIIFIDQGKVLADQKADQFFKKPVSNRAKKFLENVGDLI